MKTPRFPFALLVLSVCTLPARGARSQDMDVPVAIQVPVFLKVITFDRQLKARAGAEIVIGIAYQRGNRESVIAKDEAMQAFAAAVDGVAGLPVHVEPIDLDDELLGNAVKRLPLTFLYVTPLRATDIGAIAAVTRAARVTTLTGVPRYVSRGLAIGVGLRDGRPRILLNLEAARLEGADLAAELLKLATIVK
jgi:hypothetical protein